VANGDFDALLEWLHQRLGGRLYVTVTGPPERTTNVSLSAEGELGEHDTARTAEGRAANLPAWAEADFGEVTVLGEVLA
jgi:hypothetical protein